MILPVLVIVVASILPWNVLAMTTLAPVMLPPDPSVRMSPEAEILAVSMLPPYEGR